MHNGLVLIAEDEELMRLTLKDYMVKAGYKVDVCKGGNEAKEKIDGNNYDLIITDLKMPGADGIEILKYAKKKNIQTEIILITAYGTIDTAVEAMKQGACDYITKPFIVDDLIFKVEKIYKVKKLQKENLELAREIGQIKQFENIVGQSASMQKIFKTVKIIADTDSSVLVCGKSGTGKELIASAIHNISSRKKEPFIRINCSAIPEGLLESELFGYEKGAFTGADRQKTGKFELAEKGTLFLDDIDDMPLSLQPKLLRVLQEREFERLGGLKPIKINIRLIFATKNKLEEAVRDKIFREDLFYRLNVIQIYLPPLRDRKEDIPMLVSHFINKYAARTKRPLKKITKELLVILDCYDWPGNVRELENIVERLFVLSRGDSLDKEFLPEHFKKIPAPLNSIKEVKEYSEKEHIIKILSQVNGRKKQAAEILGISRKSLWEKMKLYNINPKDEIDNLSDTKRNDVT